MQWALPFSYAWRNMLARKLSTSVTVLGIASAVLVSVVMAATASGIRRVAASTGAAENVVVLSKGASSAEVSMLDRQTLHRLRETRGLARDEGGQGLLSPEMLIVQAVDSRTGASATRYVTVRGVTRSALDVHPRVRLTAGRLARNGNEIVVGRLVPTALGDVALGDRVTFGGREHTVVGTFEADGQVFEGEIWTDLDGMRNETGRRGASIVVLHTTDARRAKTIVDELADARHISVEGKVEPAYYDGIREAATAFVYIGNLIGLIMGLGAVAAGTNTMYAAMSRRVREMGTLRALGFSRAVVAWLVLLESLLIGTLGGALGVGLAIAFDGYALNLLGLSFELEVERASLTRGLALALAIGLVGGLAPALAAARLDIVQALRRT